MHDKVPFPTKSYSFDLASKKKAQAENGEGFPHSQARIKETYAQDPSVTKAQVQSSQAVPISGSLISVHTLSPPSPFLSLKRTKMFFLSTYVIISTHVLHQFFMSI